MVSPRVQAGPRHRAQRREDFVDLAVEQRFVDPSRVSRPLAIFGQLPIIDVRVGAIRHKAGTVDGRLVVGNTAVAVR